MSKISIIDFTGTYKSDLGEVIDVSNIDLNNQNEFREVLGCLVAVPNLVALDYTVLEKNNDKIAILLAYWFINYHFFQAVVGSGSLVNSKGVIDHNTTKLTIDKNTVLTLYDAYVLSSKAIKVSVNTNELSFEAKVLVYALLCNTQDQNVLELEGYQLDEATLNLIQELNDFNL